MNIYIVEYQYGPYSGVRTVRAASDDDAKDQVKRWAHKHSALAQASESYRVVERREGDE